MKHLGLFEGIGGFSLAAHWAGWSTPVMVEWDKYCQAVLRKNFPNATIFGDISKFDGRPHAGQFDIITGGFPCQPYSTAGERKGNDDDRALWPEMLRVIREVAPRWVVGENVAGLLSMDGGRVFESICADLENEGYTVQAFVIPAIAVGAPHRRDRVWIVAHTNSGRSKESGIQRTNLFTEPIQKRNNDAESCNANFRHSSHSASNGIGGKTGKVFSPDERQDNKLFSESEIENRIITHHASGPRFSRAERAESQQASGSVTEPNRTFAGWGEHWHEVATRICRVGDGFSAGMDGTGKIPANGPAKKGGKAQRIKALGNAIVPQVAFDIFKAINEHESTNGQT